MVRANQIVTVVIYLVFIDIIHNNQVYVKVLVINHILVAAMIINVYHVTKLVKNAMVQLREIV